MSAELFLRLRLTGDRFEGHAIPLEFLKDLAVLEEMIVETAKAEFLKDRPGRQRVSPGFAKDIELKLTKIEEGSAVAVISLDVAPSPQFWDLPYFKRAREALIEAIGAAEQNRSITEYPSEKALRYFDRFVRNLRDDEAIEFTTPTRDTSAKLTKKSRQRLVPATVRDDGPTGETMTSYMKSEAIPDALSIKELTEETTVRGTVPEADQDHMTFEVQPIVGQKVKKVPIPPQHLDTILEAFRRYKDGTRVLLQGVGRFDRVNHLLGFDSIEHITILKALDISAQLDDLRLMKNGWLEGEGLAPPHEGLDWLSQAFDDHYSENLPPPYLYPTEEGGVQAEWSLKQDEVSLRIDLGSHAGGWHALNMETDADASRTLNLDRAESWDWIGRQIQQMSESKA